MSETHASMTSPLAAIDLNQLVLLAELLETPSPTAVARRLGCTQSAVSHGLATLRELLGDPLFVRVGRSLVPTPRAMALAEPVAAWRQATARLLAKADPVDPRRLRRTFRLCMTDAAEHLVVPGLVERLRVEAPEVTIEVTNRGDDVEDLLRRGEVDLLVGFDLRPVDGLVTQNLRADQFVVASTSKRAPTLEAYAGAPHVLVAPRGGPGGVVDRALEKVGHKRFVALRTSSFAAALGAVRGPLVLTLPRCFAEAIGVPEGVRLHAPPVELPALSLRAVSATASRDDPTSQWLRGLVREVVGRG
jgi:DNA-binding transcriptional LysR family regulator